MKFPLVINYLDLPKRHIFVVLGIAGQNIPKIIFSTQTFSWKYNVLGAVQYFMLGILIYSSSRGKKPIEPAQNEALLEFDKEK